MTTHLKLENGDIVTVGTEENHSSVVGSVRGSLIGIIDGEQDKVCFIFRNGEDIVRFYLDRGGRPASRLLILLCSRIEDIRDACVEITSLKQDTPGQSRLQLAFTDGGDSGTAPYILPRDHARWNRIRISRILTALGITTEDVAPAGESSGAESEPVEVTGRPVAEEQEPRTVETVVVEGIRPADSAVTAHDTRSVRLVAGFPLLAVVYSNPVTEPLFLAGTDVTEKVRRIIDAFPTSNPRFISRVFVTRGHKDRFVEGMNAALEGTPNRYLITSCDREVIDSVFRLMDERGIE